MYFFHSSGINIFISVQPLYMCSAEDSYISADLEIFRPLFEISVNQLRHCDIFLGGGVLDLDIFAKSKKSEWKEMMKRAFI